MRCFRHPRAFPIDDVGLHNAVRLAYQLQDKPAIEELQTLFEPWAGWEAYATFYLWRALI
jgi:DNA-3-methyladenine glycosylase II